MVKYTGIQQLSTDTRTHSTLQKSEKFHHFLYLNFWKDYSIRIYLGEINNNPCKLMRRGLYRNVYTKYLRHWVIWERKYLHNFVQKVEKKLLQLWMQHKCSLCLSEDNLTLWRLVSRLSHFALMLENTSLCLLHCIFSGLPLVIVIAAMVTE